jgi:hypothetical protein
MHDLPVVVRCCMPSNHYAIRACLSIKLYAELLDARLADAVVGVLPLLSLAHDATFMANSQGRVQEMEAASKCAKATRNCA